VSVFESGVRAGGRAGGSRFSSGTAAETGARQFGKPGDAIGRAHVPNSQQEMAGSAVAGLIAKGLRLVLPVLLLIVCGAAAFSYSHTPARWTAMTGIDGKPLALGLVLMPVTFFAVHLTNRRYGAGYATAQILIAWLVVAATLPLSVRYLGQFTGGILPSLREAGGFGGALLVAQLLAAWTFDRIRGPRWWTAPLMGSLVGGIALTLIGYPAAYSGTDIAWTGPMWSYLALTAALSVALLIPYWMLRRAVPPTSGFNGY
jgi:uncharacterized PurR-regulated membrane protein YhhQ (DUF165 family)